MILGGKPVPCQAVGSSVTVASSLPTPSRCTWHLPDCMEDGQPAVLGSGRRPIVSFKKNDSGRFTEAVRFLLVSKNSAQT